MLIWAKLLLWLYVVCDVLALLRAVAVGDGNVLSNIFWLAVALFLLHKIGQVTQRSLPGRPRPRRDTAAPSVSALATVREAVELIRDVRGTRPTTGTSTPVVPLYVHQKPFDGIPDPDRED